MNIHFRNISVLLTLFLTLSCSNPTGIQRTDSDNATPEAVIQNLISSYNSQNLDDYLSNFSEDCQFREDAEFLWGLKQERQIHERLFASVTVVDLNLTEWQSEQLTEERQVGVYNYDLRMDLPTEQVLLAQGQVEFEFVKDTQERWRIQSFSEIKDQFSKFAKAAPEDSVDYFPLQVGNKWIYFDRLIPTLPDFEVLVTDSVMISGNLYFQCDKGFPFSASFARVDSLHRLRLFFEEDSTERIVFDLAADVGDSLTFIPPNATEIVVVELITHKDSLSVPAGTFPDVLDFLITDLNSGSRSHIEFAANIGMIRATGHNQELVLKGARVNGKEYGVITEVERHYFSWTQIRKSFSQPKKGG